MSNQKIIAIANQKGGVGKTTTAINLGAALALAGYKTLIVDFDPQGNASTGLGIESNDRKQSTYDLLVGRAPLSEVAIKTALTNLQIVPSSEDLYSADIDFSSRTDRTQLLKQQLASVNKETIVLIDCPPALGLLTINALVASRGVLVPLQTEFLALEGLSQIISTIKQVRQSANPQLRINGILLTMADTRTVLSQQVEQDVRATMSDLVFSVVIPRNVRVSEAPSHGAPVVTYDPQSKGSIAYMQLATEFTARLDSQLEVYHV